MPGYAPRLAAPSAIVLALTAPASAQTQPETPRVEITGSRIPRLAAETAMPVQTLTREDIRLSGAQRTEELLGRITAAVGNWNESQSVGNDNLLGASTVSLRGLGSKSTLVLLNGRRLATHAVTGASDSGVDLHAIPLAAVEQVEVLKDGASAIYGSEAIGGVVNFILRSDYAGFEVHRARGIAQHGGAGMERGGFTVGTGTLARDRYNLFAAVDYRRAEPLVGGQRSIAATSYDPARGLNALSSASFPANLPRGGGAYANPLAPACPQPSTVLLRGACYYDAAPTASLEAALEHTGLLARGAWQLNDNLQAFVEGIGSRHRQISQSSPTPLFASTNNGGRPIVVSPSNPYYPAAFAASLGINGPLVDLRYRTVALGPRTNQSDVDQGRLLAGLRGTLGAWSYDAAVGVATSSVKQTYVRGFVSSDAIVDGVAAGLINPFGDSGPAGNAALQAAQLTGQARDARNRAQQVDLRAWTDLAHWVAGTVSLAVGAEGRDEHLDDLTFPLASQVAGGSTKSPKNGSRRAQSAFVELLTPLARGLEVQWAARLDHYDDFGSTVNPKASLRWQPTARWLLRASVGSGFRAPSLSELYTAQTSATVGDNSRRDPLRCPVTNLASDCNLIITTVSGGNPALRPERSRQATVGLGFEPAKGTLATLDYWTLRVRDIIAPLTGVIFGDPFYEATAVVRGPVDPAYPTLPGPILKTLSYNMNLGHTDTRGWDLALHGQLDPPAGWGRLNLRLDGTYISTAMLSANGVNNLSVLGRYQITSTPRWTYNAGAAWSLRSLRVELAQAFRQGYLGVPDNSGTSAPVASYRRWDLNLACDLDKTQWGRGSINLGVRNLLDKDPPYAFPTSFQAGYDPSYADARKRYFTLGLGWQFQ
jgi:iron complex outermembrane receptor protein